MTKLFAAAGIAAFLSLSASALAAPNDVGTAGPTQSAMLTPSATILDSATFSRNASPFSAQPQPTSVVAGPNFTGVLTAEQSNAAYRRYLDTIVPIDRTP